MIEIKFEFWGQNQGFPIEWGVAPGCKLPSTACFRDKVQRGERLRAPAVIGRALPLPPRQRFAQRFAQECPKVSLSFPPPPDTAETKMFTNNFPRN
eukprot:3256146-Amphidinium_carterae.1